MARFARPGRVLWLGLRPDRRAPMQAAETVDITLAGLDGDRAKAGKRAVTLVQFEHLAAIAAYLGQTAVAFEDLRRNIAVSGLNLAALKGRDLRVGTAILHIEGICAPCSRMEETFGTGGYSAVRGHGGWCASVIEQGGVRLGDPVEPI